MTRILGYADRISAAAGESVRIMVSCDGLDQYDASLVRVIHGDINPSGPGYREESVVLDLGGPFKGRYQPIHMGSYAVIDNAPRLQVGASFGVRAIIWPTLPGHGPQTILSLEDAESGAGFRLYLDSQGAVAVQISASRCESRELSAKVALHAQRWYLASASYDAESGILSVAQQPLRHYAKSNVSRRVSRTVSLDGFAGDIAAPIMIAARPATAQPAAEHFNGRIESPQLLARTLLHEEMTDHTSDDRRDLIGAWDFSIGIPTDTITDVSANQLHGRLVNLPTRGVGGHAWNGDEHCWRQRPEHYAAIHFHDDDLYDCVWETDFTLTLPDRLASGVYAVRLHSGSEEYYVVLAVRPPRGTATAPAVFVMPTASYMAYANNRIGIDVSETEIVCGRLTQLNPIDLYMQEHPELGLCFYDLHNDGSGVFYSSRLRPIVDMQPKHIAHLGGAGSNVWQFNADTHILNWLEHLGQPFDVITDEDIEAEGVEILERYRVAITGTHPEYYSVRMLDGLQAYLNGGGRLMYLGGNGFYWRISYHPTLPGVTECRKSEDGIRAFVPRPGEYYSSFTCEYTGLWRRNGRAPNELVGVGMVSQGFDYSSPYVRTQASRNERAKFIFDGVESTVIGDYGLSGGGAAGLELDATDHALGTAPHALVLAASERHSDLYLLTPEDMNDPAPGLGGSEAELIRAEMVFFETPAGGAVFSTGSIAWCGSLSYANYQNDIARISANVLNRFLNSTPFDRTDQTQD